MENSKGFGFFSEFKYSTVLGSETSKYILYKSF